MKCPECGFISLSVLHQCENCGYRFPPSVDSQTHPLSSRRLRQPAGYRNGLTPATSGEDEDREAFEWQDPLAAGTGDNASVLESATVPAQGMPSDSAHTAGPSQKNSDASATEDRWRKELSRRVHKFRRRRAHLGRPFEPGSSVEFDFEGGGVETAASGSVLAGSVGSREEFDFVLRAGEEPRENLPTLDSIPLRREPEAVELHGPADADQGADELGVEARRRRSRLDPGAISIVMESSPAGELDSAPWDVPVASLGLRFLAGVADGLMLLLALGLFVGIVWWVVDGRLHLGSADLGVLGFVVGFLVLSYFAVFGSLASATPGQRTAGLMLRSVDGSAPTSSQAFWRAFGYLVSLSALMLGFVWALLDSDGLTWHDRMSGTFLASRDGCAPRR